MSKHTPGPWTIKHGYVVSGGITVAKVLQSTGPQDEYGDRTPIENHEANAERIVACVNAMDGIEDPEHFRIKGGQMSMSNETRSLTAADIRRRLEGKGLKPGEIEEQINKYITAMTQEESFDVARLNRLKMKMEDRDKGDK